MSLFGRILVIIFGLLIAVIVAGITLALGIVLPEWAAMDSDPIERVIFFFVAFFATGLVIVYALLPAALVIGILEALRMRSFIYYGVGGALVALASYYGSDISVQLENTTDVPPVANALQLAAAAGILGGLAYWLIAGRNAGRWRERRLPSA
jgi:hypothetical protein